MQSNHFDTSLLQRICDLRIAQDWNDLDLYLRKLEHTPPHLKNFINSVKGECLLNLRRRQLGIEMLERSLSQDFIDGLIFLAGMNKAESLLNPEMNSLDQINLESFPLDVYRQILLLEGLLMKLSLELEQLALSEERVKTVLRRALELAFLQVGHPGYPEHPFRSQLTKIRDFLLRQLAFFSFVTQDEQGILEYHEYIDFKGNPYALGILVICLLKNNKANLVNGDSYQRELRSLLLHKEAKQIFFDYLKQYLVKYWKEKYSGLVSSHVDQGLSTSLKKRRTIIED